MQQQNTKGFSIILALGLTLLMSFTWLYLLEYMIPYSRSVSGIENASQAFYEGYSWVEESLYQVYNWDIGSEFARVWTWLQDFSYEMRANGTILPPVWWGTSEYDNNWNSISKNKPVQILIGKWRLVTGNKRIELDIRVPDYDGISGVSNQDVLNVWDGNDDIVLWQLSSQTDTLYTRSGSLIQESHINNVRTTNMWQELWVLWDGASETFRDFYERECDEAAEECVLKISLIRDIISKNNEELPFLEYQITSSEAIPTREVRVQVRGKSFGFQRQLELSIPQQTTNTAFDFTIFQ